MEEDGLPQRRLHRLENTAVGSKQRGAASTRQDTNNSPKLGLTQFVDELYVVENLDESDQFILGRAFIRSFDVTIDLNNAIFRIRNPERKYAIKPANLIMANDNIAPIFLSRELRLKANKAAIVSLRMKNYNELSDNLQVCIVSSLNSRSAAILGRSFSITKSGL